MNRFLQAKVGSVIAVMIIVAYIGLYFLKDIKNIPMESINAVVMMIIGYYFGASDKRKREDTDD